MSLSVGTILKMVAVLQWLDGDIMQNVFNMTIAGTGGPYDEEDVLDDLLDYADDMYAHMVSRQTNDLDGSEIRVYLYDAVDDDWDEVGSRAWTYDPADVNEYVPRGVAGLINCKTTDPDLSGKKYLGGSSEAGISDGVWTSSELTALANFAAEWVTPFTGAAAAIDYQPVIWSPTRTVAYPCSGTVLIPTIPAYQRRRKQGVGI